MRDTAVWEPVLRDRSLVGRDYESAIISGAFSGFAMGATATAIANIQALTRRRDPSPKPCHRADCRRVLYRPINLAVPTFYSWPGLIIGR
jgi:ESS family glutamate:Na+ symporter